VLLVVGVKRVANNHATRIEAERPREVAT